MKSITVLALVLAAATARVPRRYFPEEDDYSNARFILMPDDNGDVHMVDLQQKEATTRASASDVTFFLHTRQNIEEPDRISATSFEGLLTSKHFNPKHKNVFVVHGWKSSSNSDVNNLLRHALLPHYDANVFIVDWSKPASKLYLTAKGAVPDIGGVIGNYIIKMMEHFKLSGSEFFLVGHSLGAHICGAAGATTGGVVKIIVGLDPAAPLFSLSNTNTRLDTTDGQFVQVIHTSTIAGMKSSIGHSDYFPNGGSKQPGCGLDLVGACAHQRACNYFAESLLSSGFTSFSCDNYDQFKRGTCRENHVSFLGELDIDHSADGDYYLNTESSEPFAIPHY